MITTASAAKWEVSFKEKGKKRYIRYEGGVNSKLREMHRNRFRLASTETAKEKFAKVKAAYGKWQQGGPTMSRELKDERFKAFKHLRRQGGAFHVLAGAGSILKIYQPCIKCRHLYRFDYIGQKATDDREKDCGQTTKHQTGSRIHLCAEQRHHLSTNYPPSSSPTDLQSLLNKGTLGPTIRPLHHQPTFNPFWKCSRSSSSPFCR